MGMIEAVMEYGWPVKGLGGPLRVLGRATEEGGKVIFTFNLSSVEDAALGSEEIFVLLMLLFQSKIIYSR